MKPPKGFDVEKHDKYVEQGGCPFVQHKTYCNAYANHTGPHWALHLEHGTKTRKVELFDAVVYEKPLDRQNR